MSVAQHKLVFQGIGKGLSIRLIIRNLSGGRVLIAKLVIGKGAQVLLLRFSIAVLYPCLGLEYQLLDWLNCQIPYRHHIGSIGS